MLVEQLMHAPTVIYSGIGTELLEHIQVIMTEDKQKAVAEAVRTNSASKFLEI